MFIAHGDGNLTMPVVEAMDFERALRQAGMQVGMLIIECDGQGAIVPA